MRILILGGGGREHALGWKLAQSEHARRIWFAPGNAGTAEIGDNAPELDANDGEAVAAFARDNAVQLVVIGPEAPLAAGAADALRQAGIAVVGPGADGARLESSKRFAKDLMALAGVPTARHRAFRRADRAEAEAYLAGQPYPLVVKASGLAAGKGVFICRNPIEAEDALRACWEARRFGDAGEEVVVEEFLEGREVSLIAVTDGVSYRLFPPVMDYKRAGEGGAGPNTGGMGAVSPVAHADEAFVAKAEARVLQPLLELLLKEGIAYSGFLFLGLMEVKGEPYVLEFNVRMGDPEAQALMPLVESDLAELLLSLGKRELQAAPLAFSGRASAAVVCASKGYPGAYEKGFEITGLEGLPADVRVFHAGTARQDGKLVTAGGRVLTVTATGPDAASAAETARRAAEQIQFEGRFFRSDIGDPPGA